MVQAFQTIISRNKRPIDTGVISVTMIHTGEATNVIPEACVMEGTVRTFTTEVLDLIEQLYSKGGVELTAPARTALRAYLDANPRGKHGSIRYDLQGQFGVSPDELRSRFGFYFDRFDVRPEHVTRN
mgnify:CR=1 FL=1